MTVVILKLKFVFYMVNYLKSFIEKLLILTMLVKNVLRTFLLLYVTMILCLILYVDI